MAPHRLDRKPIEKFGAARVVVESQDAGSVGSQRLRDRYFPHSRFAWARQARFSKMALGF